MVFGLSVFALSAVAIAAFMIATSQIDAVLGAGAIFLLAAGQFGTIVTLSIRTARLEETLASQQAGLRAVAGRADQSATRLAHVEQALSNPANSRLDEIVSEIKTLHENFRALLQPRAAAPSSTGVWPEEPGLAEPAVADSILTARPRSETARPAAPQPVASNQRLDLLLEPLIELSTGSTAHYRALLDLSDDSGQVVQHAELMEKADAGGMRPDLDAHMLKHVMPVLRRLRDRHPAMRAFVTIGLATLSDHEDMARIAGLIERDIDVAGGIVFELQHGDLGRLEAGGIDGLARLGRLGATLALADVQVAGLDLAALRQLGVRFLSVPPAAASDLAHTPAGREFVQFARAMQFQIIVAGVEASRQASLAAQVGRFAYGPFFAPPRKVRAEAGTAAAPRHATAA